MLCYYCKEKRKTKEKQTHNCFEINQEATQKIINTKISFHVSYFKGAHKVNHVFLNRKI
jgi:hypothetical protein